MSDFIILGTDTDAGKTTFSLLWLARFHETNGYWKFVESGTSDSEKIQRLIPEAIVYPTLHRFRDPVAPLLAARREGKSIPSSIEFTKAFEKLDRYRPHTLIETFGSPFSPLNETELQIPLIQKLNLPSILVSSSHLGSIGRTLQTLHALSIYGIEPKIVVLMGQKDSFAEEQLRRHWKDSFIVSMGLPSRWDSEGIRDASDKQSAILDQIRNGLVQTIPSTKERTQELFASNQKRIWYPYTSLRDPDAPLLVVGTQNEFLHLADGQKIIDGISSWWTIQHGHRHPVLMQALAEASRRFDHVLFAGMTHLPAIELAELLLQSAPWNDGKVFFSDNGSTAVEVALKMAYQYWCHRGEPQRTLFIGFENGYHGDTFGAMSVGRDPLFFGRFEPLLFRAIRIPVSAQALENALSQYAQEVAGIIIEPLIQGAGGMQMHSPEELKALFDVALKYNSIFIADEVMTGGGRTGSMWAYQQASIQPDLICASKTLAGGVLPLAATLVSPQIVEAFDTGDRQKTFFHGHSFTGHPLACAVAVANWRMLHQGEWKRSVQRIEAYWKNTFECLKGLKRIKEVRIRGIVAAIELDFPGKYLASIGREIRLSCLRKGVFLRPLGNVLYAMPPFCTSNESLERIAESMINAIRLYEPGA